LVAFGQIVSLRLASSSDVEERAMISEEARRELYTRLEQVLGAKEAATLMEHQPPVGWADVATKRDLDQTATLLRTEMTALEYRIMAGFHQELAANMRTLYLAMSASMATIASLAFAAARLI
jgi:hypothetical protein